MTRALVIQTAYLGDTVLTIPLLELLAGMYDTVDVVCAPRGAEVLQTHPTVGMIHIYDKRGSQRGLAQFAAFGRMLYALTYNIAYLPHRSWRSSLLAYIARIPVRIGFSDAPGAFLYSKRIPRTGSREIDRLAALAGAESVSLRPTMELTEGDRSAALSRLRAHGIAPEEGYVVIAPGATWSTKIWPYYRELVAVLWARGIRTVIVGDEGAGVQAVTDGAVDLCGTTSVRELAATIERARLAVTNDSGPLHLANAVATPVLAIFGPTAPHLGFAPLGEHDRVAEVQDLPCRPCSDHGPQRCPLGHHRCMVDLEPRRVAATALEMLRTTSDR